jgi:pyruvate/2-oxoglutarate dehydrogenase complex dihydrolipoamide acyltransferase (E2) component
VNAQLGPDGSIKQLDTVDISVAVATPTGLITPIVTNADARGVSSISQAIKDLAGRAREGKLKPHEYQGGSFSVSNLGMFGIAEFNAVINPPQAAIMAVGGGRTVPVPTGSSDPFAKDYTISTLMTAKVSFDERVVNSEDMAKWLTAFKTYMDDPAAMV